MNRQILIFTFIILLFSVDVFVMIFNIGGEFVDPIKNALLAVGQITAIAGGLYAIQKFGRKNKTAKTVSLFITGLIFWMIGGIIFALVDFFKGEASFPSLADVSIFVGYALLLTALIHEVKSRNVRMTGLHKFLLLLIGSLTSIVVFYLNVFLVYDPATPILITIATLIYSLGDILLATTIVLVIILAYDYSGGKLFYPWFYLFLGAISMLIGDGMFSLYIEDYLTKSGNYLIIDALWRLAYVFFALGLFNLGFVIANIQKNIPAPSKIPIQKSTK